MNVELTPDQRAFVRRAIESGSLDIADRLIETISERFLLLGAYPRIGRRRDDLRPGLRAFPVGDYLVLYRVEGNDVLIQRVVRSSRDIEALLRERLRPEEK